SALPRATVASTAPSIGDFVSNVCPEIDGTTLPSILWPMPSAFSFASSGAARSRLAWNSSADFGAALSIDGLHLQRIVDVVALPARLLVVDLHVERQREFAAREHRVEIGRQRLEDVISRRLAGCEIAAFTEPQHHVEKAVFFPAVGDRVVFAPDRADAD